MKILSGFLLIIAFVWFVFSVFINPSTPAMRMDFFAFEVGFSDGIGGYDWEVLDNPIKVGVMVIEGQEFAFECENCVDFVNAFEVSPSISGKIESWEKKDHVIGHYKAILSVHGEDVVMAFEKSQIQDKVSMWNGEKKIVYRAQFR